MLAGHLEVSGRRSASGRSTTTRTSAGPDAGEAAALPDLVADLQEITSSAAAHVPRGDTRTLGRQFDAWWTGQYRSDPYPDGWLIAP